VAPALDVAVVAVVDAAKWPTPVKARKKSSLPLRRGRP
jgi:hypothetical protein